MCSHMPRKLSQKAFPRMQQMLVCVLHMVAKAFSEQDDMSAESKCWFADDLVPRE